MLKFFFWMLLLANAALFAYRQIYVDAPAAGGHEPARMSNQLNADKIKLISAADAARATEAASPAPVESAARPQAAACVEIGNFNAEEAQQFEAKLAALPLGERLSRRAVQEVTSHIVYIPSQGDKESAEKKATELRRLGVTDFYIIQDNSSLRWGISLGVFRLEEAARAHLASLNQRGVRSARIGQRSAPTNLVAFQLRDLDADAKATVDGIKADFPKQEIRDCEAAAG